MKKNKLKEELGQRELFEPDTMVGKGISNVAMEPYLKKFKNMGQRTADNVVDQITDLVASMLTKTAKSMDIDMNTNLPEDFEGSEEYFEDSDVHMEMTTELAQAYLDGMTQVWPFPVGFDIHA